jgi:methylated-DNA-[protein]-cysteine S-methyltransferase
VLFDLRKNEICRNISKLGHKFSQTGTGTLFNPQPVTCNRDELIIMHYHIFSVTFGFMAILFEASPFSVKRILLPQKDKKSLERLVRPAGGTKEGGYPLVKDLTQKIQAYFQGRPIDCTWDILDLQNLTELQTRVLQETADIPYGSVRSYGDIAERIGHPKAARFIGATMACNPFPIVIPCHRVIGTKGRVGGYGGGVELKKRLLQLERAIKLMSS